MLFSRLKLLFTNWRLTLVQISRLAEWPIACRRGPTQNTRYVPQPGDAGPG